MANGSSLHQSYARFGHSASFFGHGVLESASAGGVAHTCAQFASAQYAKSSTAVAIPGAGWGRSAGDFLAGSLSASRLSCSASSSTCLSTCTHARTHARARAGSFLQLRGSSIRGGPPRHGAGYSEVARPTTEGRPALEACSRRADPHDPQLLLQSDG
eukprot:3992262-Prymnesium_polylepis.2